MNLDILPDSVPCTEETLGASEFNGWHLGPIVLGSLEIEISQVAVESVVYMSLDQDSYNNKVFKVSGSEKVFGTGYLPSNFLE